MLCMEWDRGGGHACLKSFHIFYPVQLATTFGNNARRKTGGMAVPVRCGSCDAVGSQAGGALTPAPVAKAVGCC